ncbi:MAG: elongation factor G [Sphingobacteriales bacterium]|nr:elongation factor G [Sphingobacteriales bacterium]
MVKTDLSKQRNIGIMAHIDAGKTTTTERILYYTGINYKIGEVHEGAATMDWMVQEQERGITITAATTRVFWNFNNTEYTINIIDTPGHVDFTVEVERSLRVLDGAIALFCAVGGVEPQSETVWKQANKYHVPRIAFINKLDRPGADYFGVIEQLKTKLAANPLPLFIPFGEELTFTGNIDVINQRVLIWDENDFGITYYHADIPDDMVDEVKNLRNQLIETISEYDDHILEKYLTSAEDITAEELDSAIRKATIEMKVTPVFCGASFKNKGIQPLLDGVVKYLPAPNDLPAIEGVNPYTEKVEHRQIDADEKFTALVFKIVTDPYVGKLAYFRVYSGTMEAGQEVLNVRTGKKERLSRLFQMHANKQNPIKEIQAGDIAAGVGFKDIKTGDTLTDVKAPLFLESIDFPEPVIGIAVEPKTQADMDKMAIALNKLAEEDPTFNVKVNNETGQTVISGMGELHLEIILDRLRREFNINCNQGTPEVAYKEALTKSTRHREVYKKQTGGKGKFADIEFELGPADPGVKGVQFINEITGGNIPREFIPAIEKGFKMAINNGVLASFPVEAVKIRLIDGSYHPVDSDSLSFESAARLGFREAAKKCGAVLMEPIMSVEVVTPEEYLGDVIGDLNRRRGQIEGADIRGISQIVKAKVPLSELFGYVTVLRTLTSGRGLSTVTFSHYQIVPEDIQKKVLAKIKGDFFFN